MCWWSFFASDKIWGGTDNDVAFEGNGRGNGKSVEAGVACELTSNQSTANAKKTNKLFILAALTAWN